VSSTPVVTLGIQTCSMTERDQNNVKTNEIKFLTQATGCTGLEFKRNINMT